MTSLSDWLTRIEAMHPSEIELGLDRVREVYLRMDFEMAGHVVIVAGTNGKGSVCAMLEAIALAAGYRVGTYTSPHLIHFNERGRINREPVTDSALVSAFEAVEKARADTALTYFEFTTLAFASIFANSQLDLNILEVGLGGRLDAVNLFEPDCAILTSVAIDHIGFLGNTREAIGWEKAHVFRAKRPAICADPAPPASVTKHAADIGADLWQLGRDFNYSGNRQQWSYQGRSQRRNALAYPALRGANQLLNASAALAALEALAQQLPVAQRDVREGLANVRLPGRFEILPGRPTVVLDAAHNPHAAAHLAANLDNMGFFPFTYAVFGVMADKDIDGMLDALGDRIDHWVVTDLPLARAAPATALQARLLARGAAQRADQSVSISTSAHSALISARNRAGENDRIVVFGSFATVAEILEAEHDFTV